MRALRIKPDQINEVLEKKGYPYRIELTGLMYEDQWYNMSREEQYAVEEDFVNTCDIYIGPSMRSTRRYFAKQGLLCSLDESLLSLLPSDMYPIDYGEHYTFPSNFQAFQYTPDKAGIYYAIVKDEIVEKYNIMTHEDLEKYMIEHDDYTVINPVDFLFDLVGRMDYEIGIWYLGINWDNEKEELYNPYKEEKEHFKLARHIDKNIRCLNDKEAAVEDADIIFAEEEKEGYTGFEYQARMINEFTTMYLMFPDHGNPYAQQFIKDLYTDRDLTNAAYYKRGKTLVFGNLELLDQDILEEDYHISSFSYEDFTKKLSGAKSKLFNMDMSLFDVCENPQIWELLLHGRTQSLGVSDFADQKCIDEIIATQPEYQDELIRKLNEYYQMLKKEKK